METVSEQKVLTYDEWKNKIRLEKFREKFAKHHFKLGAKQIVERFANCRVESK